MTEDLRFIADYYGLRNQLVQTIEELNELALECAKSFRENGITVNLISEMADVFVMMIQLIYLGKIERKDVEDVMKYKVDRQIQRIKEEENED